MKKALFLGAAACAVFICCFTTTGCGPSAAEQARLDSIRIADSLYTVDSIRMADSIAAVRALEGDSIKANQAMDEFVAQNKNKLAVKVPEARTVAYLSKFTNGVAIISCLNVSTKETK